MTATAETERCGITSLFVMSCRGKAEAFARRLQSRLSSLNKEQKEQEPNETTWLASSDQIAVAQPKHNETNVLNSESISFSQTFLRGQDEEITSGSNLHNSTDECLNLKLIESSDEEEDVDENVNDLSGSSVDYCSCLEDLSRTLTDDSFTSIESDTVRDDDELENTKIEDDRSNNGDNIKGEGDGEDEDNRKNEDDEGNPSCFPTVIEENIKNQERSSSDVEDKLYSEVIEDCDILRIHDNNKDDLCPPKDTLVKADLLDLLTAEPSDIQNGVCHDEEITPLRRCSSLRTGKTPPGTPGRKKIVRFADVLGLDLADVGTFLDEIPKIPNSAYIDLQDANLTSPSYRESPERILIPLFTQPGGLSDFLQRVHDGKVCLENALVEDLALMSVKGTVRVLNLDFHKMVHVRYTMDGWKSFSDLQCSYVVNSCDGFSDKFTFLFYANMLKIGGRLEFAIRYQCRNTIFWDNNNRCNYSFQCLPSTSCMPYSPITSEEPWGTAFYYNEDYTSPEAEDRHRHLAVQEYIAATLDKHKKVDAVYMDSKKKPNFVTVFLIVIVSVVFLYVQRAVYFT